MIVPGDDPRCVGPRCGFDPSVVFTAADYGTLAGRWREPGDEIRACPGHAEDINRSQRERSPTPLAAWLRDDANHGRVLRVREPRP